MKSLLLPVGALAAVAVVGLLGGSYLDPATQDLGVTLIVYLVAAQAWNILGGYGGQISIGAAAFIGTGAYATALLLLHTALPWWATVVGSAVAGSLLALLISFPLLRLRGDYFAVGTLAAAIALQAWVQNWAWAGGASGLSLPVDRILIGPDLYRLAVVVGTVALAVTLYVSRSEFGLRLMAIRDDEAAAVGLGVAAYRHRLLALIVSSALTASAGSVVAMQSISIAPDGMMSLTWSLNALLMSIVGGSGTFAGPVLGVFLVYYGLTKQLESIQSLSIAIEGLLLIGIVSFAPHGVWPILVRATRVVTSRLRLYRAASPVAAPAAAGVRPDFDADFEAQEPTKIKGDVV